MGILNATSTFGRGMKPTGTPDCFTFRVYTGGFAGSGTADTRASEECDKFNRDEGYSSYKIIDRRRSWVPSYYEYTVQFNKIEEKSCPKCAEQIKAAAKICRFCGYEF